MKRILSLVLISLFLASTVMAGWFDTPQNIRFSTYVSDNATGTYQATFVSKTTIVPGTARILGYTILQLNGTKNSEFVAALHDAEATDPYVDESLIDESEVNATANAGKWFPYPRSVRTQLCIRQGPNTRVIVYYEAR